MTRKSPAQSGSVLLIIMIAVAMFAALTYVIVKGGRSGSVQAITDDQARAVATEVIAFGSTMQKAVQAMRLRGVTERQFDFSNNVFTTVDGSPLWAANANCTTNACKVFHVQGGAVNGLVVPKNMLIDYSAWAGNSWAPGHAGIRVLQVKDIGTSAPDMVLVIPFLRKELCMKINDILGIPNISNNAPYDNEETHLDYNGTIAAFPNPAGFGLGNEAAEFAGKSMFCNNNAVGDWYYFWAVLLAR